MRFKLSKFICYKLSSYFRMQNVIFLMVRIPKARVSELHMNANNPLAPLSGQIALVTGAGRGIGAAIARKLASLGATVVLCGRTLKTLETAASSISALGGTAQVMQCDVSSLESVHALAAYVEQTFGRINILVNNGIRSFAPMMIRAGKGHIVNISSLAGKNALPNGAAYAASKWGLNGLSYSIAEELREHDIRVSVVCPGSVDTELSPHIGKDSKKMLQPDDVAHVVAMLVTQAPQSFASEVLLRPTRKP